MKAIFAKKVYTGKRILDNAYLIEKESIITNIVFEKPADSTIVIVDLSDKTICPLFIDLQIYGGNGFLFNTTATAEAIKKTYEHIRPQGTGYFQITLSTVDLETMLQAIDACKQYWAEGGQGLIGLHLEGPYFNPEKRGAHVAKYVRKPTLDELNILLLAGKGVISYLTLAPEMCDPECLKLLVNSGINISAGHSNATYEQSLAAFDMGISRATHLYNAMSQFQSRAPGLVGACFQSGVCASIVADGVHVDFNSIAIAKRLMAERLFYITDAVTENTAGEYAFRYNGNHYLNSENTLAGSALTMWDAVVNGVKHCGFSWQESIQMATSIPAQVANLDHKIGYLEVGYKAEYNIVTTG